jgi:hypothetical protein
MNTLVINTKGQISLSEDLVSHLGLRPGEKLVAEKLPDNRIELRAFKPTGKISDTFGSLNAKRNGRALSIEEMNKIIADGWAGKR